MRMKTPPEGKVALVRTRNVFANSHPAEDPFSLGLCEPAHLRGWLEQAAKKSECTWRPIEIVSEDLDATDQSKLAMWLDGA